MADENSQAETVPDVEPSSMIESGYWRQWLIRTLAFFIKEVNEVRRQPKLFISLVGGPFLVLLIFGATFRDPRPSIRTVLVLPPEGLVGLSTEQAEQMLGANLNVVDTVTDQQEALNLLRADDIDLVQIVPPDIQERISRGETATLEFVSNTIDPDAEGWIQFVAYSESNEVNKFIKRKTTTSGSGPKKGSTSVGKMTSIMYQPRRCETKREIHNDSSIQKVSAFSV